MRPASSHRRRRGRRLLAGALALGTLAGVVVGVATPEPSRRSAATASTATTTPSPPAPARAPVVLRPPGPIPGYLLIADRGNDRMLLVDSSGRIYWRYPGARARAMPFRFDDDTFFGPRHDRIISNQEGQDTIQVISFPAGRLLWRYGHVNVRSGSPGYLNTPDDAYLLPGSRISVADAYNCRVAFITPAHRIVRQYGTTGVCRHDPPRYLGAVNAATPLADGGTLISEIAGSWIDEIGPSGRLRWAVQAPVSYPSDPQLLGANRILLADYARPGAAVIIDRRGHVLWRYGPSSGPGELDHPSLALPLGHGLVAINDDYRHRVVIVSIRTGRIVWQYGHTDRPGTAPGYLNTPDGLDLLRTADAQASPTLVRLLGRRAARVPAAAHARHGGGLAVSEPFRLPAPVQREVAVPLGRQVVIAGGLDAGGRSTNGVFRLDPGTGALQALGTVPQRFHDAAGAIIGRSLFVFGGGDAQSSAAVQRLRLGSRSGSVVASLPRPLSDLAAATTGGATYLVGGYDGSAPRAEIYRTRDGSHFTLAGRLPEGLRYPAVAAAGSTVVIAGGVGPGGAVATISAYDTVTGRTRTLGRLPTPTAHAAAFALGGAVYVVGGTDAAGRQLTRVVRVDPSSGKVTVLRGSVPRADAAAVALAGSALVIGGSSAGTTTGSVLRLTPR